MGTNHFFIHIGFTKAASSFLQLYLEGHPKIVSIPHSKIPLQYLVFCNDLNNIPNDAIDYFLQYYQKAKAEDLVPVFSHERLSGNPHSGHYDMEAICRRLHFVFPHAKVIIVIREQYALIASIYKQYISIGGTRVLDDFLSYRWDMRMPRFDWLAYEFHRIVKLYQSVFSPENIYVALFENLVQSPTKFLSGISDFMGVLIEPSDLGVVNPGLAEKSIELKRIMNTFE